MALAPATRRYNAGWLHGHRFYRETMSAGLERFSLAPIALASGIAADAAG
jgi:hypothetical protein